MALHLHPATSIYIHPTCALPICARVCEIVCMKLCTSINRPQAKVAKKNNKWDAKNPVWISIETHTLQTQGYCFVYFVIIFVFVYLSLALASRYDTMTNTKTHSDWIGLAHITALAFEIHEQICQINCTKFDQFDNVWAIYF